MSNNSNILNAFSITTLNNLGVGFLKFLALIIHVRFVSQLEFGIASTITLIVIFYLTIIKNSFITSYVKEVRTTPSRIILLDNFCIVGSMVIGMVIFSLSANISLLISKTNIASELRIAAITIVFIGFSTAPISHLNHSLKFKELAKINLIATFFGFFCVSTGLTLIGMQALGIVLGLCVNEFLNMLLARKHFPRKHIATFSFIPERRFMNVLFSNALANSLNYFGTQGEKFIVLKFLGLSSLGLYGRSYQVMSLPSTYLGKALDTVLFPYFNLNKDDISKNKKRYLISHLSILTIFTPFSYFVYFNAESIVIILFTNSWLDTTPLIQVMSFGLVFKIIHKINSALIKSSEKLYLRAKIQAIYCILTFILTILMLKLNHGLYGVALAVTLSVIVVFLYGTLSCMRIILFSGVEQILFIIFIFFLTIINYVIYSEFLNFISNFMSIHLIFSHILTYSTIIFLNVMMSYVLYITISLDRDMR